MNTINMQFGFLEDKLYFSDSSAKAFLKTGSFLNEFTKTCFEFNFAKFRKLLPPLGTLVNILIFESKVFASAS